MEKEKILSNFKKIPKRSYESNFEFSDFTKEIIKKVDNEQKYLFNITVKKNIVKEIDKILNIENYN